MTSHRAERVRPRWGRVAVAGAAAAVTAVALLGGIATATGGGHDGPARAGAVAAAGTALTGASPRRVVGSAAQPVVAAPELHRDKGLPDASGAGYRVVFSQSRQRVWLVDGDDDVERTYLVSGSLYDNLQPGTYAVFSRSEHAYSFDGSGTMDWFVRFAEGATSAIGFHDIPIAYGAPAQTNAELGTPQSHGCIRQKPVDAAALWAFAPVGTAVVVTA